MEEVMMYEAVMITSTNIAVLRVSNSKKQLKEFIRNYINTYVKDLYSWDDMKSLNGENCYTIMRNNNDFVAAFKIRKVSCIVASPKELAEEDQERERETEKTAKNDRYAE